MEVSEPLLVVPARDRYIRGQAAAGTQCLLPAPIVPPAPPALEDINRGRGRLFLGIRVGVSNRHISGRIHPAFLLFWIALAVVAYFGMDALVKPRVASITVSEGGGAEIVIPRSRNGHYYVAGTINGHPTTFMIDTGATTVAIDPALARAAKVPKGFSATFNTASGPAEGEVVPQQSVGVGNLHLDDIRIAVIDGIGEYSLLGQNVLRHLEVIQSGDQMILRARTLPGGNTR